VELTIVAFNGIGGVNQTANLGNSNTITTTINSTYKKDEDLIVVNNSNNEENAEIWHIFSRYGIGRNARTRKLAGQTV
jgi:hypothetical protein